MRRAAAVAVAAAGLALVSAPGASGKAPPARPMRVMSLMQCADELVMMLLPPERISSVTYLAESGAPTPALAAKARALRSNHGLAEELLAETPDLIVAGSFTTPATRRLAKQVGIPVIELNPAETFDDIRAQTRRLGAAVGEGARAEALIARMDATLAALARTAPKRRIVAVGWNGAGRVAGRRSLFDAILTAAGGYNAAADAGAFERSLDLEQLLALKPQPDVLLYGVSARIKVGARIDQVQHPALLRAYGARRLSYPQGDYSCGTPYTADDAAALRKAILVAVSQPPAHP